MPRDAERDESTEQGGDHRRYDADNETGPETVKDVIPLEQSPIPFDGEAGPFHGELGGVEGEGHQHEDWQVQEQVDREDHPDEPARERAAHRYLLSGAASRMRR